MLSKIDKPWGHEEILHELGLMRVKRLVVKEGHRTSLQYHIHKAEVWFFPTTGAYTVIAPKQEHRLTGPVEVIEVSTGSDDDIVRLEDDYGR